MADRARDPETLEREIERTRAELARTIDALADRVNPKHAVRRSVGRLKDEVDQVAAAVGSMVSPEDGAEARRLPGDRRSVAIVVGAGVALSVTAAVLWRRRRRR
jgi:uncharacterized protein DUF3618